MQVDGFKRLPLLRVCLNTSQAEGTDANLKPAGRSFPEVVERLDQVPFSTTMTKMAFTPPF